MAGLTPRGSSRPYSSSHIKGLPIPDQARGTRLWHISYRVTRKDVLSGLATGSECALSRHVLGDVCRKPLRFIEPNHVNGSLTLPIAAVGTVMKEY
jgi:hypothetical protein